MKSVCVCLVSGLPGSGKSSFCKSFQKRNHSDTLKTFSFAHIEYDALMPMPAMDSDSAGVVGVAAVVNSDNSLSWWKQDRMSVLKLVEAFMKYLHFDDLHFYEFKPGDVVSEDIWVRFQQIVSPFMKKQHQETSKVIILVDDNFYLHSMRYEYYKLARQFGCGFCQIFMDCSCALAIERNAMRSQEAQVPEDVILRMANKLEPPNARKFHWEAHTHFVNYDTDEDFTKVVQLFEEALTSPVQPLQGPDEEDVMRSRQECSASFLHQIDLILRKCIAIFMSSSKRSYSPTHLQQMNKKIPRLKEKILKDFRDGLYSIDSAHLHSSIEDSAKDPSSELFLFVNDIFSSETMQIINEITAT